MNYQEKRTVTKKKVVNPQRQPYSPYDMPLPPQGPSQPQKGPQKGQQKGQPQQRAQPAPSDYGGNWSSIEDTEAQYQPTKVITKRQERVKQVADARRDVNYKMQAEFQHWSGENDFIPYNSANPRPLPDTSQSTKLVRTFEKDVDPHVPSFAKPEYKPLQPPPQADFAITLDHVMGKPDSNVVALTKKDDTGTLADHNAYPQVYKDEPFLQIPQSNLILNPIPVYISLDSRDRDRVAWPQTNRYRIPFVSSSTSTNVNVTGDRLRNIYSISVLSCVVPNVAGVFSQPYLLLQFDEIDGTYDSPNLPTEKAFTKLYFREAGSNIFLRLDKSVGDPSTRIYWPAPRATLDHLTVSFRNYDGTLFDFGADSSPPTDPITTLQNTLTLEIRTYVTDTVKALGHRNV